MTAPFGLTAFGLGAFGGIDPDSLGDWQFELAGARFGRGLPVIVTSFDRGGSDVRAQDQPAGRGDWMNFGTDRKTPGVWAWTLETVLRDGPSALAALEDLEAVWDAPDTRGAPGEVLPLRYRHFGVTRVVFGRPRRFTAPLTTQVAQGRIKIAADFQLAEAWSYDDVEQSVQLSVGAAVTSGQAVTFPTRFPRLWGGSAGRPGTRNITVGGRRPTWLSAVFTGPITDPYLIVGDQVLQLRGILPAGVANRITVSSLPWAQGVYRSSDGAPAPVYLDAASRLAQLRVAPGEHLLTFGGIDNTGSATCAVSWRDANNSI